MALKTINLVAVDMGYGHKRAAYPLLNLSGGEIISINDYPDIPAWEREYWVKSLSSYEGFSRLKKVPIVGNLIFGLMDALQKIPPLYPFRDLSKPIIQQKFFYKFITRGLGRHLIEKLSPTGLPFVTTFFVAADIAEYYNYPGPIYCIICDTDASRAWAPLKPQESRTKFFVPSDKVKERFLMYGVKEENIIVTGFPLPLENVGADKEILREDLGRRVAILDPQGVYREHYKSLLKKVAPESLADTVRPVVITFSVGGAGAQKEIGATIMRQLAARIRNKTIVLNLVAGSRPDVRDYFTTELARTGLVAGQGVNIIFAPDKLDYFRKFNECLHTTDILWTKPSELSFYCALGLPIIISAPVGSQEDFNREWLLSVGAGIDSWPEKYVDDWLPDLLQSGRLARSAMDGFLNAEQLGAYHIAKIVSSC
jgi:hypothetical protein